MTTPVENHILAVLERRGHARIGAVSDDLCGLLGRYVSPGAVRVHLSTMCSAGKVQRIGHGVYCLNGKAPAVFTLQGWVEEEVRNTWPGACTARSIAARRRVDRGERVSIALMGEYLRILHETGKVDETSEGSGAFIWRTAAPSPAAADIFS